MDQRQVRNFWCYEGWNGGPEGSKVKSQLFFVWGLILHEFYVMCDSTLAAAHVCSPMLGSSTQVQGEGDFGAQECPAGRSIMRDVVLGIWGQENQQNKQNQGFEKCSSPGFAGQDF